MKLEGGKIASSNLIFLIISFILGSSLIFPPAIHAKHDAWLAILVGLGVGLFFAIIYTTLAIKFPGKTLCQFNDIIYGPYLGKVISIGYLWFFFHTGSLVLRWIGELFTLLLPQTPMEVFLFSIMLICASAVRNGIEVITRCSLILVPVMVFLFTGTTILLLKDMDFTNFLPIFDLPLHEFIKSSFDAVAFPFSQLVVFLMVFPFLNNPKQAKKSTTMALISGAMILLMLSMQNIATLGVTANISTFPTFQAVRLINVEEVFNRLEVIVSFNFIAMVFLKITVLYYSTVLGTAQLFKLRSYQHLVFPVGILMIIFSIFQLDSIMAHFNFISDTWPYYSAPFQLGIPLLSLIIVKIRGLPKK